MIWNIVSDSSCDLLMTDFKSDLIRFETVPLRLQVGEREFIDDDELLEITPKSLRMRKRELNHELRARAAFRAKQQQG